MGNSQSKTSFRVTGLTGVDSDGEFRNTLEALGADMNQRTKTSLAIQINSLTGTASCSSKSHKKHLMRRSRNITLAGCQWANAGIDDSFSGLTMLRSPENAEIE